MMIGEKRIKNIEIFMLKEFLRVMVKGIERV